MSQERTQIFRGDDAPEMGIAETADVTPARRSQSPVDQRALSDNKDGPQGERREMRDAERGAVEQRQVNDADDGAIEQRRADDAQDGAIEQRRADDAQDGPVEQRRADDAQEGPAEQRRTDDADAGPSVEHRMDDAQGPSDMREMRDAEGVSEQRALNDADGLSELRQLHDHKAALPAELGGKPEVQLNFNDDEEPEPAPEPVAVAPVKPAFDPPSPKDDADLTFKVERDATPWALSIHLEERIASLGLTTAKVNEQLDALEASTRRLAKRVGK